MDDLYSLNFNFKLVTNIVGSFRTIYTGFRNVLKFSKYRW